MKQFLYLDNDIVNSIIAQTEKGFILEFSKETESGNSHTKGKKVGGMATGEAGGSIWTLANAAIKADLQGTLDSEKSIHSSSRELITKTLHDASFDIACEKIKPDKIELDDSRHIHHGEYIEIKRAFEVVDFEYLEQIFSKGEFIEFVKEAEEEKIKEDISKQTETLNRQQRRANSGEIQREIKKKIAENSKQYDEFKKIIDCIKQIIPYNRMMLSSDGYLIPLDDQYFRIDPQNLGFKYGGEITCVGMITNIIGFSTNSFDFDNIFAIIQFSVNEVLRSVLPTKEENLYIMHPIAVFYGE